MTMRAALTVVGVASAFLVGTSVFGRLVAVEPSDLGLLVGIVVGGAASAFAYTIVKDGPRALQRALRPSHGEHGPQH